MRHGQHHNPLPGMEAPTAGKCSGTARRPSAVVSRSGRGGGEARRRDSSAARRQLKDRIRSAGRGAAEWLRARRRRSVSPPGGPWCCCASLRVRLESRYQGRQAARASSFETRERHDPKVPDKLAVMLENPCPPGHRTGRDERPWLRKRRRWAGVTMGGTQGEAGCRAGGGRRKRVDHKRDDSQLQTSKICVQDATSQGVLC